MYSLNMLNKTLFNTQIRYYDIILINFLNKYTHIKLKKQIFRFDD